MFVVTAQRMRELDSYTIERIGIPGPVLMENAARGALLVLDRCFPHWRNGKLAVVCGRGNNGGDGLVMARYLLQWGGYVNVFLAAPPEEISGDARFALETFLGSGGRIQTVGVKGGLSPKDLQLSTYSLIVDALLGTGLRAEVREPVASLIKAINESGVPVLSVDIPSGLCSDTGRVMGVAVKAQVTVTFGSPKLGQFLFPGRELCGSLYVVDIGIPQKAYEAHPPMCQLVTPGMLRGMLPHRSPEAHKGNFGHVLVIAGSAGKTGAGVMAAESALRTGAGLVTLGVPKSLNLAMEAKTTEVMTLPLPEGPEQNLSLDSLSEIRKALEGKDCVVLGPGISTVGETPLVARELASTVPLPMVIDADGLNALVGHLEIMLQAPGDRILTPHPGEMARLLSCSIKEVQEDRVGAALELAQRSRSVVVLKGAGTIIGDPEGEVRLIPTGNPAMASAGMGDVLTGIIAGLLAQGLEPMDAASLGVYVHGFIADEWSLIYGQRGLVATDLVSRIPGCLDRILNGKAPRKWPSELTPSCPLLL